MRKLPKLGMRNISTAISVLIVYATYVLIGRDDAFYACIATVVATQINTSESIKAGKARLVGTLLGGIVGFCAMTIMVQLNSKLDILIVPISVSILIYICTILNRPQSVQIGCIVLLSTVISHKPDGLTVYSYVLTRLADTLYGVVVAVLVGIVIFKILDHKNYKKSVSMEQDTEIDI